MLGDGDAFEFLNYLKLLKLSHIPVILMTGLSDQNIAIKAIKNGVFDYILKPLNIDEIISSIKKALELKRKKILESNLYKSILKKHIILEDIIKDKTSELTNSLSNIEKAHFESIILLTESIEAKDKITSGHSNRVLSLASLFIKPLKLNAKEEKILKFSAILHDIGKIGIPVSILNKKEELTRKEINVIRKHPDIGANILDKVKYFKDLVPIVRAHHEKYDGLGYPNKLKGDKIPLFSRIITICDAYDAMTQKRPYKSKITKPNAINEILKNINKQFDPKLSKLFNSIIKKKDIEKNINKLKYDVKVN